MNRPATAHFLRLSEGYIQKILTNDIIMLMYSLSVMCLDQVIQIDELTGKSTCLMHSPHEGHLKP